MDQNFRHRINVGRELVREQVGFFRRQFSNVQSNWKYDGSRVTFADIAISEKICSGLAKHFPGDDICSEEANPDVPAWAMKSKYAWLLDPVDGTNNFAIGMPMCAISLGLLKDGVPAYGFLYDFGRDVLIEGGPGFGITDGEHKVQEFVQQPLGGKSMISMGFPLRDETAVKLGPLVERFNVRSIGSGALSLAYVAMGKLAGCVDLRSKSWDVAASMAFLGAVGGRVEYLGKTHFPLREFDVHQKACPFFAGTEEFCAECLRLLK